MFDDVAHLDVMRREAERIVSNRTESRDGIVANYDGNRYMARVQIEPEGFLTGWLPIGALMAGKNFGVYCGLSIGQPVKVEFVNGDINGGRVGFSFNSAAIGNSPPVPCLPGQILLVDPKGSAVKITNDGNVAVSASSNIFFSVGSVSVLVETSGVKITVGSKTWTFNDAGFTDSSGNVEETHVHQYIPGSGTPTNTLGPTG